MNLGAPFTFALCDPQRLVEHPDDLWHMAQALEANAAHCADAWELARPAVAVVDDARALPAISNCHPVVLVGEPGPSGVLAIHSWDWLRHTTSSRVFVPKTSGLRGGRQSICEGAGHEILEALVNPLLNQWRAHPQDPKVQVALEGCDPVQDTYDVLVIWRRETTRWPVANFVLPAWFDHEAPGPYDHAGTLTAPGQLGPDGYAILRDPKDGRTFPVWGSRGIPGADRQTALQHLAARTRRLGVLVENLVDP